MIANNRLPETNRKRDRTFRYILVEKGWWFFLRARTLKCTEYGILEGRDASIISLKCEYYKHCINIVIYLSEDRQNVGVKIITRCLPMSPRNWLTEIDSIMIIPLVYRLTLAAEWFTILWIYLRLKIIVK